MATNKNKHGLSRNISNSVKQKVRKACGFGCVICGLGIYQYEHILPEFHNAKYHDPDKIALLCGACHQKVTANIFSKAFVKERRDNPYCKNTGPRDFLDFSTEAPDVIIGGMTTYRPKVILSIMGTNVLEIVSPVSPGGAIRISGKFYDSIGTLRFVINDNEWEAKNNGIWDITTIGQTLTIKRSPDDIALRFTVNPRENIIISHLNMYFSGMHVLANDKGIFFGPDMTSLFGVSGTIIEPKCCIAVAQTGVLLGSSAFGMIQPNKNLVFKNNTASGSDWALIATFPSYQIGLGKDAIKSTISKVEWSGGRNFQCHHGTDVPKRNRCVGHGS
jgi:hypothetical protein